MTELVLSLLVGVTVYPFDDSIVDPDQIARYELAEQARSRALTAAERARISGELTAEFAYLEAALLAIFDDRPPFNRPLPQVEGRSCLNQAMNDLLLALWCPSPLFTGIEGDRPTPALARLCAGQARPRPRRFLWNRDLADLFFVNGRYAIHAWGIALRQAHFARELRRLWSQEFVPIGLYGGMMGHFYNALRADTGADIAQMVGRAIHPVNVFTLGRAIRLIELGPAARDALWESYLAHTQDPMTATVTSWVMAGSGDPRLRLIDPAPLNLYERRYWEYRTNAPPGRDLRFTRAFFFHEWTGCSKWYAPHGLPRRPGLCQDPDDIPPELICSGRRVIQPPDVPLTYKPRAADECGIRSVRVRRHHCFAIDEAGRRRRRSCRVRERGDRLVIEDTGGAGTHITFQVEATDNNGNRTREDCEVRVERTRRYDLDEHRCGQRDHEPPEVQCNVPEAIRASELPAAFIIGFADECSLHLIAIGEPECRPDEEGGARGGGRAPCEAQRAGDTVSIASAAPGDTVQWSVEATDTAGNTTRTICAVVIVEDVAGDAAPGTHHDHGDDHDDHDNDHGDHDNDHGEHDRPHR